MRQNVRSSAGVRIDLPNCLPVIYYICEDELEKPVVVRLKTLTRSIQVQSKCWEQAIKFGTVQKRSGPIPVILSALSLETLLQVRICTKLTSPLG